MKRYAKILTLVLCFSCMLIATGFMTNAASYNYNFWKNALPSAEGLTYKEIGEHFSNQGIKVSVTVIRKRMLDFK